MKKIYKALILDDDHIVRGILARFLDRRGWACVLVDSGGAALASFGPGEFDLVLSDIDLGSEPDGIAAVLQMLALDRDQYAVMMSGDRGNLQEAEAIGLNVIEKPFDLHDIGALLLRAEVHGRRTEKRL